MWSNSERNAHCCLCCAWNSRSFSSNYETVMRCHKWNGASPSPRLSFNVINWVACCLIALCVRANLFQSPLKRVLGRLARNIFQRLLSPYLLSGLFIVVLWLVIEHTERARQTSPSHKFPLSASIKTFGLVSLSTYVARHGATGNELELIGWENENFWDIFRLAFFADPFRRENLFLGLEKRSRRNLSSTYFIKSWSSLYAHS